MIGPVIDIPVDNTRPKLECYHDYFWNKKTGTLSILEHSSNGKTTITEIMGWNHNFEVSQIETKAISNPYYEGIYYSAAQTKTNYQKEHESVGYIHNPSINLLLKNENHYITALFNTIPVEFQIAVKPYKGYRWLIISIICQSKMAQEYFLDNGILFCIWAIQCFYKKLTVSAFETGLRLDPIRLLGSLGLHASNDTITAMKNIDKIMPSGFLSPLLVESFKYKNIVRCLNKLNDSQIIRSTYYLQDIKSFKSEGLCYEVLSEKSLPLPVIAESLREIRIHCKTLDEQYTLQIIENVSCSEDIISLNNLLFKRVMWRRNREVLREYKDIKLIVFIQYDFILKQHYKNGIIETFPTPHLEGNNIIKAIDSEMACFHIKRHLPYSYIYLTDFADIFAGSTSLYLYHGDKPKLIEVSEDKFKELTITNIKNIDGENCKVDCEPKITCWFNTAINERNLPYISRVKITFYKYLVSPMFNNTVRPMLIACYLFLPSCYLATGSTFHYRNQSFNSTYFKSFHNWKVDLHDLWKRVSYYNI